MTVSRRGLLSILLSLLLFTSTGAQDREEKKVDPYSSASAYILLLEVDDTLIDGLETLEVTDPRMFALLYNKNTDRLLMIGDDDGRREIPSFTTMFTPIASDAFVVINFDGDFDTTFSETLPNPLIDTGGLPMGVRWPDTATFPEQVGKVIGIDHVSTELARDGTTTVNRSTLNLQTVEQIPRDGGNLQWNMAVSTAVEMWHNGTGSRFVVTKVVIRDPDASLTAYTGTMSMGTTTPYTNVIAPHGLSDFAAAGDMQIWTPNDAKSHVIADGEGLFIDTSAVTTGHIYVDIWGYYV